MRKSRFAVIITMLILGLGTASAQDNGGYHERDFSGGSGTEEDPWQIVTPEHLGNVRNYLGVAHGDKHFKLMNDIDLADEFLPGGAFYNNGQGWEPDEWTPVENGFHTEIMDNILFITGVYPNPMRSAASVAYITTGFSPVSLEITTPRAAWSEPGNWEPPPRENTPPGGTTETAGGRNSHPACTSYGSEAWNGRLSPE